MNRRSPHAPGTPLAHSLTRRVALAVCGGAMLTLVAACGPTPKDESGRVRRVGVVILTQSSAAATPAGQAAFVELTEARTRASMEYALNPAVGTCTVGAPHAAGAGAVEAAAGGARLNVGTAGLNANGLPFGELQPTGTGAYRLSGATGPLPVAGLTLTVPNGAAYPGVDALAVATGQTPVLAAGIDASAIGLDTEFRWQPSSGAATLLLMGTGSGVAFSCFADDAAGSFEFPEATRSELAAAGFTLGQLGVLGRLTTTTATVGESDLLLVGVLRLVALGSDQ